MSMGMLSVRILEVREVVLPCVCCVNRAAVRSTDALWWFLWALPSLTVKSLKVCYPNQQMSYMLARPSQLCFC